MVENYYMTGEILGEEDQLKKIEERQKKLSGNSIEELPPFLNQLGYPS